jgi:polysaccharide chain length determinant protein (PEP-CTERM system associated)
MLEEQKVEEADFAVSSGDVGRNYSPMLQQLNIALAEAEAVVASMSARTSEYSGRYDRLKSMSEAIPIVEAEFTQLNRDYEVNRANYEKLLERRASARMSGELTSASALMSFRIVDPPTVPDEPSGPDRALFFTIVLLAGLGIGLGIAFVVSQIRPAFYSQASLREVTGLQVLGAVPMVWTAQEKTKRKKRLYAFAFSIFVLLTLYMFLIMYMKM